jgi:hypothetical protein
MSRLGLGVVITMLLAAAAGAPVHAQAAGDTGGDASQRTEQPVPRSGRPNITTHAPQIIPGHTLPGQGDIPERERLGTPDRIIFSATVSGSGGGAMQGGGQCTPSAVTVRIELQLPGIEAHMSPPAPLGGGNGGFVTVPTWFWATYVGDSHPSSSSSDSYTTCSAHTDAQGRTWWSPSQQTATIRLSSAPVGYEWDFGDRDVGVSCGDPDAGATDGMGAAGQPAIHHQYCVSSIRTNHPDGYPVFVEAQFMAQASIDDQAMPDMQVYTRSIRRYPVREVQAVVDE